MLRFLLTILCFCGILCIGNIAQRKKIGEGRSSDTVTRLEESIRPAFAFLHSGQRVFYKGLDFAENYHYYFVATQLMAPTYLLESRKEAPRPGDTLLLICNNNEFQKYFPKNDLQIIWQHTDAQYNYFLGKQL